MHDLVDIGANLTHDSFDADREAVLERAAAAGVRRMIVTGSTASASHDAVELSRRYPGRLFATAGVHPHHADEFTSETRVVLLELATVAEVVAIGECGLDFFRNFSSPDAQRHAFDQQLGIAVATCKPVFLHQRDAHALFVDMLRHYSPDLTGGVAHCFTGTGVQMREYLELGLYIGITGWICDERRGQELREAVPDLPLDRVLLETDAPYLLPRDLREKPAGRRNEPALLPHVLQTLARHMGLPAHAIATAATRNAERLFGLPS